MNRRSFCENLEILTLFGCNRRNWLPDRAPRIVWPRSLAVFTMTIIVKIGRIIAPPIAHRALISFKLLAFPIGRNSLLSRWRRARSSVTECGRYRESEHEPARELSTDRRPIDNRHPLIVGARWRVLSARPGERCRRPSRRQAMGAERDAPPSACAGPLELCRSPVSRRAGDGALP